MCEVRCPLSQSTDLFIGTSVLLSGTDANSALPSADNTVTYFQQQTCWFSPLTLVLPSCFLLANAPFFVSQRAQEIHTRYHPTYWNGNATVPRNRLSFSSSRLVLREYPSSTSTNLRRCFLHNGMQVPLKILNACFNTNEAQPYTQGDTLNSFVSSCPLHLHGLGTVLGCITEVFLTWLSLPRVELTVIFNYHTFYGFTAVGFTTVNVEFFEFG